MVKCLPYLSSQINSHPCKRRQPDVIFGQLVAHSNSKSGSGRFSEIKTLYPLPTNFLSIFLKLKTLKLKINRENVHVCVCGGGGKRQKET